MTGKEINKNHPKASENLLKESDEKIEFCLKHSSTSKRSRKAGAKFCTFQESDKLMQFLLHLITLK